MFSFTEEWLGVLNSMQTFLTSVLFLLPIASPTEQKLALVKTKNGSAYLISKTSPTHSATPNDYRVGTPAFLKTKNQCTGQPYIFAL